MNTKILKIFLVFILFSHPLFSQNSKPTRADRNTSTNTSKNIKSLAHKKMNNQPPSSDIEQKEQIWTDKERQEIIKELDKKIEESKKELENLARNGSYFGLECECDKEQTFNLGVIFYNQHYFGQSQRHGIKISTHMIIYADADNHFSQKPSFVTLGFDIKYLYDFWKIKDFTFGLNAGLGYQKSFLFDSQKYQSAKTISESQKAISELKYNFVNVVGIHIRYHFYQLEILSGHPNYLRVTIAYRY